MNLDMGKPESGQVIGRQPRRFVVFRVLIVILSVALMEGIAYIRFGLSPIEEKTRQVLAGETLLGETDVPDIGHSVGQAYLLYVGAPNYVNDHGPQHNSQGYRGEEVAVRRTEGVARIVCLGGSTTYGFEIKKSDDTYPAQLQRFLTERLPEGVKGVEVINGGLPWGTTAELLTHYHFKYHYYRADLVIINTGGNDPSPYLWPYYQPDYNNWRKPFDSPQPLPTVWGRGLMRSRLVSLFVLPIFFGDRVQTGNLRRGLGDPPLVHWYPETGQNTEEEFSVPDIPADDIAFRHNLRSLIAEIQQDGARVLLVPFRPAPQSHYPKLYQQTIDSNESIMKELAKERSVRVAPFPANIIGPNDWMDRCHLNVAGAGQKARHIAEYAFDVLWKSKELQDDT